MGSKLILLFATLFAALSLFAQPLNDDCINASPITIPASGNTCVNGTLVGATDDGTFSPCESAGSKEVWFTFIATGSNNTIVVTPSGSSPATNLVVNVTNAVCSLSTLNTCNTATTPGGSATASWGYAPGTQVWVSVSSTSGSTGTFQLCVTSVTTPPSDGKDCNTAVPICSMNSFTAPVAAGANGFLPPCFTSALQQPLIFKFTVGQAGLLNWRATPTCGPPNAAFTEFDWAVYDITNGCPGTVVACNYNYTASSFFPVPITTPQGMQGGPAAGCNRTSVTGSTAMEICPGVTVNAGRTYAIILDQFTAGSSCNIDFNFNGSTFQLAPTAAFTLSPSTGCDNITVSFNNTSVASTTYAWTFGDGTTSNSQNPPSKTYSTPGTYLASLTTTSASGCTSVASQSIQVIPSPVVSLRDTTICPGRSALLAAVPDISGGTYSWSPGGQTTSSITVSPATNTTYTVTYTLLGCNATATATVNIAAAAFTVNAGNDTAICTGRSLTLDASVQPPGTYTYQWSPSGTLNASNILNPLATPTAASTYTLSVTDAQGCVKTDAVQVAVNPIPTVTASVNTANICVGQQVQLNAVANPPSTFAWLPATGPNAVSNPALANPTASPTNPQKYYVFATAGGCSAVDSVSVNVDTARVDAGPDRTICTGTSTALNATVIGTVLPGPPSFTWTTLNNVNVGSGQSINVTPSANTTYVVTMGGGACVQRDTITISIGSLTPQASVQNITCSGASNGKVIISITSSPPYTFNWSTNANTANVDSAVNLSAGAYQVTVTDGNNCSGSVSAAITEPSPVTYTQIITRVSCFGGNDGAISVSPSGGTGSYSYSWSNAATTAAINALTGGNYSLTISDANACTVTASFTVTEPADSLSFNNPVVTHVPCNGTANGGITVSVTGGTTPYSYAWSHNSSLNNATAGSLTAGTYTVTLTDNHGCTAAQSNSITEPDAINPGTPVVSAASCYGSTDGTITMNPTGGVGSFTYTWNGTSGANPRNNLTAGNYTVVVTDANGCTASASAAINQPAPINITTNITHATCYGASDGSISLTVTGGFPTFTFNWAGYGNSDNLSSLTGGTYNCVVTDVNSCSASVNATVLEPSPLDVSLQSTGVNCTDDWNGTISVFPTGGTAPYSYSASKDGSYFFYSDSVTISGMPTGLYTVYVSDKNGCIITDTISVADALADEFIFTVDSTSCFGDTYRDGAIYITEMTMANRPYRYSLDGGEYQFTADFFDLAAGEHTLIAVNQYGCETVHKIMVPEPPDATAFIIPSDTVIELGQTISLQTQFGPYSSSIVTSYHWSPSLGLSCTDCPNPEVTSYNRNNEYTLLITYNRICTVSATARIRVEDRPEIFIPNSFSPNGDGNNDVFLIYGAAIKKMDLKIFNRWGELVFQSDNQYSGWDGIYKGTLQQPGVFTYQAVITYLDNYQIERFGSIMLLK